MSPGLAQRGLAQEEQDDEPEQRERHGGEERGLQRLGEPGRDRDMEGIGQRGALRGRPRVADPGGIWSAVTPAAVSWGMVLRSRRVSSAPKTATPIAPPRDRKKVAPEVATPRSAWGTAFWVASTRAGITMPMPVMNMDTPASQSEVSTESRLISVSPPAAISRPATGRIL